LIHYLYYATLRLANQIINTLKNKSHPYHYSTEKTFIHRIIDLGVPVFLFFLYFQFYNFGKITPSEMIKTTGLLAIALLSLTLLIGPLCRFFPSLDILKAHRQFWGIASFIAALVHFGLIMIYDLHLDFLKLLDTSDPDFLGHWAGIGAFLILTAVVLTSIPKLLHSMDPKIWKFIQTTSYLALILAVVHFYLIESTNGVLVIKRLLGQITFAFAGLVVLIRILVALLPSRT